MNIQNILQPRFIIAYLVCLLMLMIAGRLLGRRRGAFELWFVAVATSGLITVLLGFALLASFFEPRVAGTFSPFPFVLLAVGPAFLGCLILFGLSRALKPPTQATAQRFIFGVLGTLVFNVAFVALPMITGTSITLRVMSAQKQPIAGATFTYTSELNKKTQTATSDVSGRIRFRLNLGDSINGHILPLSGYTDVELDVSTRCDWFVMRKWRTCFGGKEFQLFGVFVSELDDRTDHSIYVYLPRCDRAELLPYKQLKGLADQYKKFQAATSHLDPYSKQVDELCREFDPESLMQNLESYVQFPEIVRVLEDPKKSGYPLIICQYLSQQNSELRKLLAKIVKDTVDEGLREKALSQMLSVFSISAADVVAWQEKRRLIQERLDSDSSIISKVLKEAGLEQYLPKNKR